jgi:hypothetical protein
MDAERLEAIATHAEGEVYVESELITELLHEIQNLQAQARHYDFLIQLSKEQTIRNQRIMDRVRRTINGLYAIHRFRSYESWLRKYRGVNDELKEIEDLVEWMYDEEPYIEALRKTGASGSVLAAAKALMEPDGRVPEFLTK